MSLQEILQVIKEDWNVSGTGGKPVVFAKDVLFSDSRFITSRFITNPDFRKYKYHIAVYRKRSSDPTTYCKYTVKHEQVIMVDLYIRCDDWETEYEELNMRRTEICRMIHNIIDARKNTIPGIVSIKADENNLFEVDEYLRASNPFKVVVIHTTLPKKT